MLFGDLIINLCVHVFFLTATEISYERDREHKKSNTILRLSTI